MTSRLADSLSAAGILTSRQEWRKRCAFVRILLGSRRRARGENVGCRARPCLENRSHAAQTRRGLANRSAGAATCGTPSMSMTSSAGSARGTATKPVPTACPVGPDADAARATSSFQRRFPAVPVVAQLQEITPDSRGKSLPPATPIDEEVVEVGRACNAVVPLHGDEIDDSGVVCGQGARKHVGRQEVHPLLAERQQVLRGPRPAMRRPILRRGGCARSMARWPAPLPCAERGLGECRSGPSIRAGDRSTWWLDYRNSRAASIAEGFLRRM